MGILDSILGGAGAGAGGWALPAVGLVSSLFGGKKNNGSADLRAGRGYLGQQAGVADTYGDLSSEALGQFAGDDAAARRATSDYADYLREEPYTDTASQAYLNRATAANTRNAQGAEAALQNSVLRRGLGTDSGAFVGGLAGIEGTALNNRSNAENDLAMQKANRRQVNMQALMSLLGNQAGQDYSRGTATLGQREGILGNLGGRYLNMGGQEQQQAQQYDDATGTALAGLVGGAVSDYTRNKYLEGILNPKGGDSLPGVGAPDAEGVYSYPNSTYDPSTFSLPVKLPVTTQKPTMRSSGLIF